MNKVEIRKQVKELFLENHENLEKQNDTVVQKIIESQEYKNASVVLAYMALPDELNLKQIIMSCIQNNKKTAVPCVISEQQGIMQFCFLEADKKGNIKTKKGSFGIEEPVINKQNIVDLESLKKENILFLVPGRAFTKEGYRLGRGKGFYDRFLTQAQTMKNVCIAGVCFSFQIFDEIPVQEHDIQMNKIFY